MKWYSVKKYRPPSCQYVFIRAVNELSESEQLFDRYFVAMIEDFNDIENLDAWEMANSALHADLRLVEYNVTHFCIPEPVEIEE